MNKETKTTAWSMVISCVIILIMIVDMLFAGNGKRYNEDIVIENIVSNWECTVDGKKIDKKISLEHKFTNLEVGSKVVFTKKSKALEDIEYPVLICDFLFCSASVFYDDKLVYTYGYNKGISSKKEVMVQLEDYKKGKEIRIELNIVNPERKVFMGEAVLIEEIQMMKYRLRHNVFGFLLSGFMAIFGIVVIIITMSLKSKSTDVKLLFWIALFSTTLAVFLVAKKNFFIYIFEEQFITELALTIAIVVVIPSIFRIHLYMYKDEKIKKIFKIFFSINIIFAGVFLILEDFLGRYVNTIDLIGITFLIIVVGLIILLVKDIKNVDGLSRFFDGGMFMIYGIILSMVMVLLFFDYIVFIEVFETGIMLIGAVLLLFVLIYYSYKIKEYMNYMAEDKVLEMLAFTDPLTGMMNRTKYEQELKKIREDKYSEYTVISFDLNCLKQMNDNNGHEAGDEYIVSFSKALRIGFGEDGFIARIGGDEFIAIIQNKYVDIETNIEMMQTILKSTMKKYKNMEISFSYGIAISEKGQKKTIDELIEMSDEKMYANKRKLKEEW